MKKIFAILMAVILTFSLCACGKKDSDTSALVGRWVADVYDSDDYSYKIIDFYDDGVYLLHYSKKMDSIDGGNGWYGSWEVRDGNVIMYSNGEGDYSALYIKSDTELFSDNGLVYEKVK